jgi:hypothetical protein
MTKADPGIEKTIDPNRTYNSAETAWLVFGTGRRWLYKNIRELEKLGFPRSIRPVGNYRWSGAMLLDWIEREQGPRRAAQLRAVAADEKAMADTRRELANLVKGLDQ